MRWWGALAALALVLASPAGSREVAVAVLRDGAAERTLLPFEVLRREVADLVGDEFDVRFLDTADGGWTLPGIDAELQRILADPAVDVVVALGLVSSHRAAAIAELPKPVIAVTVADAALQGFPRAGRASGKRNFVYVDTLRDVDEAVDALAALVDFDHLVVLADALSVEAIPTLAAKTRQISERLDARVSLVSGTDSPDAMLAALPGDADAVLVTPLLRLSEASLRRLAEGLAERGLPSLSLVGREEVQLGLLLGVSGAPGSDARLARRIALNLQRVLLGEEAGTISVAFSEPRRLTINMRTARRTGYLPRWAVLVDAEKLFEAEPEAARPLTLRQAMDLAVAANLDLAAARLDVSLAQDDTRDARSTLLPQLQLNAGDVRIDADRANPLFQAERMVDAELGGSQLVYSDDAHAGLFAARRLEQAAALGVRALVLDTLQDAATAFLTLLRTRALEAVRASNLEVTRANLELARVREQIGATGRADVLRWETQIAGDRQALLQAQADRFRARTELNRVLNEPQNQDVSPRRDGLDEALAVLGEPRFEAFVGNPLVWETFQDFSVADALADSPELDRLDEVIGAGERELLAARRAFYVPSVALQASAGRILERGGAGSTPPPGVDDETWSIALQASLPVFNGGALRARASRAGHQLAQRQRERAALAERIEARMRAALQQVGGSYPAIELSRDAARAARANLDLVTDAYSEGAVSVTDLIDAQDAALSAELAAAESEYAFLIDYVEVLRASGSFDLLLQPGNMAAWYDRVEAWFRERGVAPLRR